MNEPMTVEVLLDTYEDLISLETRINVAAEYALHEKKPSIITVLRILGTASALDAVEKLEK